MKSNLKRIGIALLLLSLLLVLTSCGGPEATYKSANNLLAKGKYAEAAEKFASLGSYEDATYLAIYADACAKGESDDPNLIMSAINAFYSLSGFKDSDMRVPYYWGRFCEYALEHTDAIDRFQTAETALEYYKNIPLFLDCSTRIKALETTIPSLKEEAYNDAINKAESGNYDAAYTLFDKLNGYKDSKTRITYYVIRSDEAMLTKPTDQDAVYGIAQRYSKLGNVIDCNQRAATLYAQADKIVADKYAQIETYMSTASYDKASDLLENFGKYGNERVKDYALLIAERYLEQKDWRNVSNIRYRANLSNDEMNALESNTAEKLYNQGQYAAAISIYTVYDTKERDKRAKEIQQEHWLDMIKTADVGDSIFFGTYEQHEFYTGLEPIKWTVLAKENNRLLVISTYVLDAQRYHRASTRVTWETCTLRKWLNSDFINAAFTTEQQKYIPTVVVPADQNPKYATDYGNVTNDKIFLLSISEVNQYFPTNEAMTCKGTLEADEMSSIGGSWWWLRTPGESQDTAVFIWADDGIRYYGDDVDYDRMGVRPAMWIELEPQ